MEPLITTLHDNQRSVREAAADALDGVGWSPDRGEPGAAYWVARRQWGKCVKPAAIKPLIAVLDDEDEVVRKGASRTLVRIGARAAEPLIDSLDRADWTTEALLVDIGSPAVEPLVAHLRDEPSGRRETIATALGRIGDARAVQPLIQMLDDRDEAVRAAAASALGALGDPQALEPLIGVVRRRAGYERRAAADALDALNWGPDTEPAAVGYWIAKEQWDKCVQVAAAEPLIDALGDEIRSVREGAAAALGQIGDPRAVGPLIAVLHDGGEDVEVCRAAARALVAIYHSGKLDQETKATVLAQRDAIMYEEADRDELRFGSRRLPDRTIGVSFPL